MSHTTTMKQKVTDLPLFCAIAAGLGHKVKQAEQGKTFTVSHFGSNSVEAKAEVHLKDWKYPLAVTETGEIMYDHWGSKHNTIQYLGETLQEYNQELISNNIPYDQLENWSTKKVANGDVVITLEY